ncbi:unnamed protein product [Protopolystoma xenopodis]|uniref:Uncharacterized protein n=1 Tax=Protopolystoma xenopodis TaxID=117903 RepID=A0A448WLK9_9PLAT|nr:unnamed protein product [Protopolystoma xenopodis]
MVGGRCREQVNRPFIRATCTDPSLCDGPDALDFGTQCLTRAAIFNHSFNAHLNCNPLRHFLSRDRIALLFLRFMLFFFCRD